MWGPRSIAINNVQLVNITTISQSLGFMVVKTIMKDGVILQLTPFCNLLHSELEHHHAIWVNPGTFYGDDFQFANCWLFPEATYNEQPGALHRLRTSLFVLPTPRINAKCGACFCPDDSHAFACQHTLYI